MEEKITRKAWLGWALLVFWIPFQLNYDYLLNAFYHFGTPYNDAGLLAQLSWHGDWRLSTPLVYTNYPFLGVHCMLIMQLLNGLSYLVPLPMAEFYSIFIALINASLGLAMFYGFSCCIKARNHLHMAALALFSIAFAFNTVVMNGIWMGHFEYAIPLGIFLFLLFFARQQWRLATVFFVFTLLMREDAGLHIITVLGLLALLRFAKHRSLRKLKPEALYIVCALLFTGFAFWVTAAFRDYYSGIMGGVYLGNPPLAHLSWSLLAGRLKLIAGEHPYLWLGLIFTSITAIRARNIYYMVGYVACIPWFLVNWMAFNNNTGHLYAYYAFPFILILMWPMLAMFWRYGNDVPHKAMRQAMTLQMLLILSGLFVWGDGDDGLQFEPYYGARWGAYTIQQSTLNRRLVQDFVVKFETGAGDLGTVAGDEGMLSLIKYGQYQGRDLVRIDTKNPVDTVAYMESVRGYQFPPVVAQVQKNHLIHHYCLQGTTICLFSNRSFAQVAPLSTYLIEIPYKVPPISPVP